MDIKKNYIEAAKAIKEAILNSQYRAVSSVNKEQLSLYYGIGEYVSKNSREDFWGTGAIESISQQLQKELPGLRGFSTRSIKNMRQFYEEWQPVINRQPVAAELEIVENKDEISTETLLALNQQPLAATLDINTFLSISFTHHIEILNKTNTIDERLFYIQQTIQYRLSKYALRELLKADTFHHQGSMPNNFLQTLPDNYHSLKAIQMFKDEYLLDFINVEQLGERDIEDIDERVVENAIVANIKKFIMTFGQDFSFIGNQYRIEVAGEELFLDLLFFNRELNSLVAIELKSGKFRSSYLGQLNTYLSALDTYVRKPHENPSIGIILCKEMNQTFVEFAVRDYNKPMGVATYRTSEEMPEHLRNALPDIEELKKLL